MNYALNDHISVILLLIAITPEQLLPIFNCIVGRFTQFSFGNCPSLLMLPFKQFPLEMCSVRLD